MPRTLFRRGTAVGCVVLAGSLLVPPQAVADPVPTRPGIAAAGASIVARQVPAFTETRAAQPQTPPTASNPDLQSGSFFKSRVGIVVLAAFGVGVGYALYSASNDRIKSPGR